MASLADKELAIGSAVIVKGGTGCSETRDGTEPHTTISAQLGVVTDIFTFDDGECDVAVMFVNSPPDVPDMQVTETFFFQRRDVRTFPLAA